MEMLFKFGRDGNVVIDDPRTTQCPAIMDVYKDKHMGSKMVRWIANVCDYYSPYARLPRDQRREAVTFAIYSKKTLKQTGSDLVKHAMSEYMRLQYDPLLEQYSIINDQLASANKHIRELQLQMDETDDSDKKAELSNQFNQEVKRNQRLVESRQDLQEKILKEREEGNKIAGLTGAENESSFLEDLQAMKSGR